MHVLLTLVATLAVHRNQHDSPDRDVTQNASSSIDQPAQHAKFAHDLTRDASWCGDAVRPLTASALARAVGPSEPTVAFCVMGLIRTFVVESVHRSLKSNLIDSLSPGRSDVFLFMSGNELDEQAINATRWPVTGGAVRYACSGMNVLAAPGMLEKVSEVPYDRHGHWSKGGSLRQDLCVGESGPRSCLTRALRPRLDACYTSTELTEAVHSPRRYDYVFLTRPDLLWLKPVNADELLRPDRSFHFNDFLGVCPRHVMSAVWPCNFLCGGYVGGGFCKTGMPAGMTQTLNTSEVFWPTLPDCAETVRLWT